MRSVAKSIKFARSTKSHEIHQIHRNVHNFDPDPRGAESELCTFPWNLEIVEIPLRCASDETCESCLNCQPRIHGHSFMTSLVHISLDRPRQVFNFEYKIQMPNEKDTLNHYETDCIVSAEAYTSQKQRKTASNSCTNISVS